MDEWMSKSPVSIFNRYNNVDCWMTRITNNNQKQVKTSGL